MASGGRHGLAQSVFQVGGNVGSAIGPLLAAFIVVPNGRGSIAWFSVIALVGDGDPVAGRRLVQAPPGGAGARGRSAPPTALIDAAAPARGHRHRRARDPGLLQALLSGEPVELLHLLPDRHASASRCRRRRSTCSCSCCAAAVGTVIGGPIGDRFGRKIVIWGSILGVLPFTLLLPYADLTWTAVLTVIIGLIISSAFSTIVVYRAGAGARPVGMISGLFFGLAFGIGGLGAARPRRARRPHQHRACLLAVLVPAGDRAAHRVPAQYRAEAEGGVSGSPAIFRRAGHSCGGAASLPYSGSHQQLKGGDPVSHCRSPRMAVTGTWSLASCELRAS